MILDENKVQEQVDKAKTVHEFNESLGSFARNLLVDYKLMLMRVKWFSFQHKPNMRHDVKMKINQSLKHIESAINSVLSLLNSAPEQKQEMVSQLEDQNLTELFLLREQLGTLKDEILGEITDLVEKHLKEKERLG